ncbi:MAG TPA: hypothetical protein VMA72_08190 [Streptosporangiaceae bacterium]|nr:hypothetical protein [Streptosporangiaceae bacterium]
MNTELVQRLHADMDEATRDIRVPPGLALKAYRHYRKRTMTTRVVAAAGAAAVLAAGTLTVAEVTGAFGRAAGGLQVRTTAYVISRVEGALSAPDMANVVAYTRTAFPAGTTIQPVPGGVTGSGGPGTGASRTGGYELLWAYHHTTKLSEFTATGQRIFDERLTVGTGSLATTVVTYTSHTWWTAQSARPAVGRPRSAGCLPGGEIRLSGGNGNAWPAFIRSQLACGSYTVAGKESVGGVGALKITASSGHLTLWVNARTYLPMRLAAGGLVRTSFRWLAPTPANLTLLNLPVPASFHQIVPPSQVARPS